MSLFQQFTKELVRAVAQASTQKTTPSRPGARPAAPGVARRPAPVKPPTACCSRGGR